MRAFVTFLLLACTTSVVHGMGMESFGNEELPEANYRDWPNAIHIVNSENRIYHRWVNGSSSFYFQGNTAELNDALLKFSAIKANRLTLVIHPGPGQAHSLKRDREFTFGWHLHLLGGISKHMSTLHLGSGIWDPSPFLHIYVGNDITLEDLQIPKGVEVLEIADLQIRYSKGLESNDRTVRGWSCGHIARLDPYSDESMRRLVSMLSDSDDWVKLNAAGALASYTEFSEEVIRELEAVTTNDDRLRKRVKQSARKLRESQREPNEREEFQQQLTSIHTYIESLRND